MTDKKQTEQSQAMRDFFKQAGAGAAEVETQRPDPQDWETKPILTGTVTEVEALTVDDRPTHRATVQTDSGEVSLWESASLTRVFGTLKKGDLIFVEYTGMKPLKGGREIRTFNVAVKPAKGV